MNLAFIVTRADDLGGAQIHVRDLCASLQALGHHPTVLAGGRGVFTGELDRLGVPWRSVPHLAVPIHPARDAAALLSLVRMLRELRPDLVLTHTAKAGMLGRAAARILDLPAIFTPHGWSITDRISPAHGRLFKALEKLAARVTDRIVNVCGYEMRLALQHGVAGAEKMAVVHNGLPDIPQRFRAQPAADPPRLVMVARMAEPKDHATLLRAVSGLRDRPWSLDLVGGGPRQDDLQTLACDLGIPERVRFRGFRQDVAACLAEAQILVLSSRFEAFPYVTLEAMRAGLPVVASEVGGIPEAVAHGMTGLLVPPGEPRALRDSLAVLIGNPRLRQQFGQAGRERFLERFTLERMIAGTLRVYGEVLKQTSPSPAACCASSSPSVTSAGPRHHRPPG